VASRGRGETTPVQVRNRTRRPLVTHCWGKTRFCETAGL
jgi:hypothetical protein